MYTSEWLRKGTRNSSFTSGPSILFRLKNIKMEIFEFNRQVQVAVAYNMATENAFGILNCQDFPYKIILFS